MWLTVLEADDGSWADDPLPTDGLKETAIDNAHAMWPVIPPGHRIALYRCEIDANGVTSTASPGECAEALLAEREENDKCYALMLSTIMLLRRIDGVITWETTPLGSGFQTELDRFLLELMIFTTPDAPASHPSPPDGLGS